MRAAQLAHDRVHSLREQPHSLPSLKQKQTCLHTVHTPHGDINGTVSSQSLYDREASPAHEERMHTQRHSNKQAQQAKLAATEAMGQLTFSPCTESTRARVVDKGQ